MNLAGVGEGETFKIYFISLKHAQMVCPICTGIGVNAIATTISGSAAIASTIGAVAASRKRKQPPASNKPKKTSKLAPEKPLNG